MSLSSSLTSCICIFLLFTPTSPQLCMQLEVSPPTEEFRFRFPCSKPISLSFHLVLKEGHLLITSVPVCINEGAGWGFSHGVDITFLPALWKPGLPAGKMTLYHSFCTLILSYRDEWREVEMEIEEGSCAGQNVRIGLESVYIRPLLCCSLECNMLKVVFTPSSGVCVSPVNDF